MVDGEQVLVCGLSEHVHDERCLAAAQAETPEPDTPYVHQHDYSCYVNGVLVCTLQETEPAEPEFVMDPAAADPEELAKAAPAKPGQTEEPEQAELRKAEIPAGYLNIRD